MNALLLAAACDPPRPISWGLVVVILAGMVLSGWVAWLFMRDL